MNPRTWLAAVALFFAWGFVLHASGLLLHELGGHALSGIVLGCGVERVDLTFFGHGMVHYAACGRWTLATVLVADWAGLALTIAAGLGAGVLLRRRRDLAPMTRLLVAMVAFFFLLGQLGYMTSGGFHGLYDPGLAARLLRARGLQPLVWIPPLVAYTAAAFVYARVAVDAFRAHFRSRSRRHGVAQLALTLGVSGALYFAAFRLEWAIRTDMKMRGVAAEARRVAVARNEPPPFPIELVLLAVAIVALAAALARPIRPAGDAEPLTVPRRTAAIVWASAAASFVVLLVLILR